MSTSTLTSLAQLITSAVSTIEQSCTSRNIPLPSIDEPFCAKTEALRLSDPKVMAAASHIAAAASQLAAIVMPSTNTVMTNATLVSCLLRSVTGMEGEVCQLLTVHLGLWIFSFIFRPL